MNITAATLIGNGSSPRVRGTLNDNTRARIQPRFIPACAGNTRRGAPRAATSTVHPRVCGEHPPPVVQQVQARGSSPRVRGTRHRARPRLRPRRFIPACAGNTGGSRARPRLRPVHPRVCGEHQTCPAISEGMPGSSPRVRGTPRDTERPRACPRFIPACAGNTRPVPRRADRPPVHPRVCGEHIVQATITGDTDGSSPRVRGTRRRGKRDGRVVRFIPACAGNTAPSCYPSQ